MNALSGKLPFHGHGICTEAANQGPGKSLLRARIASVWLGQGLADAIGCRSPHGDHATPPCERLCLTSHSPPLAGSTPISPCASTDSHCFRKFETNPVADVTGGRQPLRIGNPVDGYVYTNISDLVQIVDPSGCLFACFSQRHKSCGTRIRAVSGSRTGFEKGTKTAGGFLPIIRDSRKPSAGGSCTDQRSTV